MAEALSDCDLQSLGKLLRAKDNFDFGLVFEVNLQWIDALTVKGYGLERKRIGNMTRDCAHYRFPSISCFIAHIQQLKKGMKEKDGVDPEEHDRLADLKEALFDDGVCQECALYITINMDKLLKRNKQCNTMIKNICCGNREVTESTMIEEFSFEVDDCLNGGCNLSMAIPCMQYVQCNKIIMNRRNLWMNHIFVGLNVMIFSIHHACKQHIDGKGHTEYLTATAFSNLAIFLFQIIRNLSSWKRRHWKSLLRGNSELIFDFIAFQLEHEFYLLHERGKFVLFSLLILMSKAVHKMHNNFVGALNITKLQEWCQRLMMRNFQKFLDEETLAVSFMFLNVPWFVGEMNHMINRRLRKVQDLKWKDMQCQRGKCSIRRNNSVLRKCGSCRCVRYCSRRCQKRDWNEHKSQCRKLKQYIRNSED